MTPQLIDGDGEHRVSDTEPAWTGLGRYGVTNLLVMLVQILGWACLLTLMDQSRLFWGVRAVALLIFCLMMQGVFTMLHEHCHRNAHADPRVNYLIGWFSATLFGTMPTLLRLQHWSHHRRNRTEAERAEFIHEGEDAWEKTLKYFLAIFGGLWLACFLFPLMAPFLPYSAVYRIRRDKQFNFIAAGFEEVNHAEWLHMRLEGFACYVCWGALCFLGPWHWQTLVMAYAAFAFSWSSLQWVYHLYTPLHAVEGAYNLRVPLAVRWLFLNFNCNLMHHRQPSLPWQELYTRIDHAETQPLWLRYLLIFRPPIPMPADPGKLQKMLEKRYF